jgi:putative SOS response-associated peptidase YedK
VDMAERKGLGDMCNLDSMTTAQAAMRSLFDVDPEHDKTGNAQPLSAIWPKYEAPVIRVSDTGKREMLNMSWGFLTPQVSKKTGKPISPAAWNNARADKVTTNGLWKESFRQRRCLVPATSFREAKGRNPATNYWFALTGREARPPFAFAGLWRDLQPGLPNDKMGLCTHTIITTLANDIVKPVHPDRMPVILDPADYETWLHGTEDEAYALLRPFPAERMQIVRQGVGILKDELA